MAVEPGDLLSSGSTEVLGALGRRLRASRQDLGRTLASVAQEANISVSYLSEVESGSSTPSLAVLVRLAHALSLSLNELLRATSAAPITTGTLDPSRFGVTPMSAEQLRLHVVSLVADTNERGQCPLPVEGSDLFVHVRAGRIRLVIGELSYDLADGDSLEATRPPAVSWMTIGEAPCVSIWATQRPQASR